MMKLALLVEMVANCSDVDTVCTTTCHSMYYMFSYIIINVIDDGIIECFKAWLS